MLYAIASMLLFSVGNVILKTTVVQAKLGKLDATAIAGIVVVCIAAAAIVYFLFLRPVLPPGALLGLSVLLAISAAGVALEILALQSGQVALVNAVLGLSTVGVAVLSYVFLGDRFTIKEISAIVLATACMVILAL